ncbi:MAG: FixH family protein [Thermodesulfovibrionales bacterium]|nr:FixH family protein [Thermodesulfovibrionales bacterium]
MIVLFIMHIKELKIFLLPLAIILVFFSNSCARHPVNDIKTDCAINAGACIKTIGVDDIRAMFDVNPKPVKTMKELVFNINIKKGEVPVEDAMVSLNLTMPGMFMGINKPALTHKGKGRYEGKGVIPRCPSGLKIWKADVTIERGERVASGSYTFEVD